MHGKEMIRGYLIYTKPFARLNGHGAVGDDVIQSAASNEQIQI